MLHQSPASDANKVYSMTTTRNKSVTTFTFSETVTNLSFQIMDIDSVDRDFYDAVALSSASPWTGTRVNATQLQGTGTTSSPWRPWNYAQAVDDQTGTAGNVRVNFPTVTSFDLHYWNISDGWSTTLDGDQRIFLSDFTLTYDACP